MLANQLPKSKIFKFIDNRYNFIFHFLEAQELIHDQAITHGFNAQGLAFLRELVLSTQPLISFLKPGEGLGIYIDSDNPKFMFKLETNYSGQMRTLLMPEDFDQFPKTLTGNCRLTKVQPGKYAPYTSIIKLNKTPIAEAANKILSESYQVNNQVLVSQNTDQSLMIGKLPIISGRDQFEDIPIEEYFTRNKTLIDQVFSMIGGEEKDIVQELAKHKLVFQGSVPVTFHCHCSHQKMVDNLRTLQADDQQHLFEEGNNFIELKCDYCKTLYKITKDEVERPHH